ncbi:MAG: acyl-[acyl-carrier-protein]--UDP-N-acetylglucosamine O-acyltransferase [Halobacteriovoraceae bacterium]|nr:acyl-[acyl-carrier-protein]--UDP-N-acetylglucosamine O-acyltransferase [Peredibacter sp.]MBJ00881.1 acyl-[acyl-carrier-protein]--UDP-N-acetylglucosamine O-acyltransferase [Halobacteriovoraceae bacterium]MBJ01180.1 acyl-[acyl-carrier-protein]--UDP-N-acetylglucosamine O-acyltransferase [Halobacteriovoraceae bacterium]|tara:strand:+ start:5052 stop:5846 length:795 start_codon:yes stop_codon:yes gene_type:complete
MSVEIHPTAIVEEGAKFGDNVKIGPYCIIGSNVSIGDGTKLKSHVVLEGHTIIGKNNDIHQFCSIGVPPQDKGYKGEPTETIIGDNNLFRENVTIHRATTKQNHKTVVGSNGYFMAGVHIAHDCVVGDNVTMANNTLLAGHVHIGDFVQMGGACGITPFVNIGRGAFIGAASAIDRDIPHFCAALGNRIRLKGVNIIGMKRRGYSKDHISEVVEFYRIMEASAFSPKAFVEHPENIEDYKNNPVIQELVEFISKSEIGLPPFMS